MSSSSLSTPSVLSSPSLPRLTQAHAPLTHAVEVVNELGAREQVQIPAERPLTIYVDKRELVTLMTLGAQPELLVLGYLRNQRLVESVFDIESITVDWEVHAAAVRTRHGIARSARPARSSPRAADRAACLAGSWTRWTASSCPTPA